MQSADQPQGKRPVGRPPGDDYTQEVGDKICQEMTLGRSLRSIVKDDGMPSMTSVLKWLVVHHNFAMQYARAREAQADALADEILDISDDGSNDWMVANDKDNAGYRENGEAINRSRLRIDARKWLAGKMRPKKYGEKFLNEHTGADGGPIQTEATKPRDLAKAMALIIAKGLKAKDEPNG